MCSHEFDGGNGGSQGSSSPVLTRASTVHDRLKGGNVTRQAEGLACMRSRARQAQNGRCTISAKDQARNSAH